jgi:ankyrin repeat protein
MVLECATSGRKTSNPITEIMELVALALRPLTYHELADAEEARSSWDDDYVPTIDHPASFFTAHSEIFKLLWNEVHFSHPLLHTYLLAEESPIPRWRPANRPNLHHRFGGFYLQYLASNHGRKLLESVIVRPEDVAAPERRSDFLSYAVQYWLDHVRLAGTEWYLQSPEVQEFLFDTDLLDSWARVYWRCTSSATSPTLDMSGPLTIVIERGPESVLETIFTAHKGTSWLQRQHLNGLLAAARVGRHDTVHDLLQIQTLEEEWFDLVLEAALESQSKTTISLIASRMPADYPSSAIVPCSLKVALELGQNNVSRELFSRVLWQDINEKTKTGVVSAAVIGNDEEMVKLMLQVFQGLKACDLYKLLLEATRYGKIGVSGILMSRLLALVDQDEGPSSSQPEEISAPLDDNVSASGSSAKSSSRSHNNGEGQISEKLPKAAISAQDPERLPTKTTQTMSDTSEWPYNNVSSFAGPALNLAIIYGQYGALQNLIDVLREKEQMPVSIDPLKSLLDSAIERCRPTCLSVLLHAYQNAFDKRRVLALASSKGDLAVIREILHSGAVIDDETFLMIFRRVVNRTPIPPEIGKYFLAEGRNSVSHDIFVDEISSMEGIMGPQPNRAKIVKLLIDAGADLERKTIGGCRTPLYHAAGHGYEEIVEIMVNAGADVNASEDTDRRWCPIHAAYGNVRILRLLLEAGANVNAKAIGGITALSLAARWGHRDCAAKILEYKPELNVTMQASTILSTSVYHGYPDIADLLLDKGENPCRPTTKNMNALLLHRCVWNGYADLLQRLLLFDFDLEFRDWLGRSALNCVRAGTVNHIAASRLLIRRGGDIETRDDYQDSPLSNAVRANELSLVSLFLSEGANVNAPFGLGPKETPLLHACSQSPSLDIVKLLIEKGADIRYVSEGFNGTVFQAACQNQHDGAKREIISYLMDKDLVDGNQTSHWWGSNLNIACLMTETDIVDLLIRRGADLHAVDRVGRRPVHFALYRTMEHVELLCDRKDKNNADLFALDYMKRGALHFAVLSGRLNIVQHIITQRRGIAKDKDCDGWSPIFWAVRVSSQWRVQTSERAAIIEELLNDGADIMDTVECMDRTWTLFTIARYHGLGNDILNLLAPTEAQIVKSDHCKFGGTVSQPHDV